MSDFLKQLEQDNNTIFYNPDEFAFKLNWNGSDIIAIDETPSEQTQFTHGINTEAMIIRCCKKVFVRYPVSQELVRINGIQHRVISVRQDINDIVIRLERLIT